MYNSLAEVLCFLGVQRTDQSPSEKKASQQRVNPVLQRQLCRLPHLAVGDVARMMRSEKATCLLDVINADLNSIGEMLNNLTLASALWEFFNTDFRT